MTIIYKSGKRHTNSDGLNRCPLDNFKINTAYYLEVAAKIPIHFMEIGRERNFKFSKWAPGIGTLDTDHIGPEETETLMLGRSASEIQSELFNSGNKSYARHKQLIILG
ncbi:hypothetical protein O181_083463 [Austropuccinia psidii MF-1]|uniref:Uncharacterized protein n=1 Tax=Austropuccinia psidii MF-1 TaxID=1389203 RepID=A0A9Q3FTQ2_9BASI|nr:hypothetical protein [Austropuccinia psidii MF-1]